MRPGSAETASLLSKCPPLERDVLSIVARKRFWSGVSVMRKLEREVKRTVSSLRGTASGVRKGQMRQSVRGTACPVVALLHGAITSILR